jgi:hypothetical protein
LGPFSEVCQGNPYVPYQFDSNYAVTAHPYVYNDPL